MEAHKPIPSIGPRLSPHADFALRWIAVALTLAGAVMVFVNPAIAFPFIAIGMALVAVEQTDKRRGRHEDR